jgi:Tol biopolymer transport system component
MISRKTLQVQSLTEPAAGSKGDCCPAMAPDGRKLAFLRAFLDGGWNLYTLDLTPDYRALREPRQLTREHSGVENPMWAADSRELFYITDREGERTLWRMPSDGSRGATPVESLGPVGYHWAISPQGDRFVYRDSRTNRDIWRADLPDCKEVKRIVSSSTSELYPEIAPDGKRIAFLSERESGLGLWVSDIDGANAIRLTPIAGIPQGPGRWSPDGNEIVFGCQNGANDDICVIPSRGGPVQRLTWNSAEDLNPSWSHDGKWIYFSSNRSGSFQIWKMPASGSESAGIPLTKGGGRYPVESPDGTTVYFAREEVSAGIWKTATAGGTESQIGDFRILGCKVQNFAVTGRGVYYVTSADPEKWFEIWMYRFSDGKTERISRISKKRIWAGLTVAPDDLWLAFTASEAQGGDLYMVENFR